VYKILLDWQSFVIVYKASAMNTLHEISHLTSSSTISICFVNYAYLASRICDDIPRPVIIMNMLIWFKCPLRDVDDSWIILGKYSVYSVNSNAKTYQLDPIQKMRLFSHAYFFHQQIWAKCMCCFNIRNLLFMVDSPIRGKIRV
jgi:hypothetical protein